MRKLFMTNIWEYEIIKNEGEGIKGYGWKLNVFKNDELVYWNSAFGGI